MLKPDTPLLSDKDLGRFVNTQDEVEVYDDLANNVFCPTGIGGGIDPTCSPNKGGGFGGGARGGKGRKVKQKKDTVKSLRSKKHYNPATIDKQRASDKLETKVASALGLDRTGDNLPMDNIAKDGKIGIEIKMIHDAKDNKVHMRKDSRQRKEAWINQEKGRKAFTVIVDNRDKFQGGKHKSKFSGNKIYWREGVGAFRLHKMNTASSLKDLKKQLGI